MWWIWSTTWIPSEIKQCLITKTTWSPPTRWVNISKLCCCIVLAQKTSQSHHCRLHLLRLWWRAILFYYHSNDNGRTGLWILHTCKIIYHNLWVVSHVMKKMERLIRNNSENSSLLLELNSSLFKGWYNVNINSLWKP